jgi:hypothetical protein
MAHDTDENRLIAEQNTVLRCQVGSRLHGVVVDSQDDSDEMGIIIEPPEYVIRPPDEFTGFKWFRQYEHRTANRGERSTATDECLISYSLRKWCGLAAKGDPTVLLPLFAPQEFVSEIAWPGHDLRSRRDMFLSKQVGDRYLGYLGRQFACLMGEAPTRTNRPELVAVHGYDTKYAFHALRLAYQGFELLSTHTLTLPMVGPQHAALTALRNGELTLASVLTLISAAREALIDMHNICKLPDRPNNARISEWMVDTYRSWWAEQG